MAVTDTNYNALWAVTDVLNQNGVFDVNTAVRDAGTLQGALYKLMNSIVTNFNGALAKLDADAGVTDTDYVTNAALSTLISQLITALGMHQRDLVPALQEIETNFEIR